jgi:hypothetical protein
MMTLKEHFRLLSSDSPSERAIAGLILNRSRNPRYHNAVRQMVLREEHHLPLMIVAHQIVSWSDDTLDRLLAKSQDDRVLFVLLESARRQKRRVPAELILKFLNDKSVFVRLAALKQAIFADLDVELVTKVEKLSLDAMNLEFIVTPNMPSPIFRHKSEFLRHLSRFQWLVTHRLHAKTIGPNAGKNHSAAT